MSANPLDRPQKNHLLPVAVVLLAATGGLTLWLSGTQAALTPPTDAGLSLVSCLAYLCLLVGVCGLYRTAPMRRSRPGRPFSPGLILLLAYLLPVWISWLPRALIDAFAAPGLPISLARFAPAWYPWLPAVQGAALLVLLLAGGEGKSLKQETLPLPRWIEGALWGLGAWLAFMFSYRLVAGLIPVPAIAPPTLPQFAVDVIAGLLLLPLSGEIFFRGRLLETWQARHGEVNGSLLSAFIFALATLRPVLWLPAFLAGLALNALAHHSHGLTLPILAHALVNGLLLIVLAGVMI